MSNKTVTKQKGKSSDRMLRLFNSLQWLNEQRHLYSIRTAFISAMPLMIVGAFAVVINQFPVPAYQEFMAGLFGERWRMLGTVAFNATTQIVTLFVIWSICSNLAQWYNDHKRRQVHAGICGMVGLASYVAMALPLSAEAIPFTMVGATGLFVAMLVGILSAEAFVQIVSLKRESMVLSDDPNVAVPQSFASIMPAIYVVGGFALVRVILAALGVEAPLTDLVTDLLRTPYENTDSSPLATGMLFNVSTHLMWLFGIHGNNVLDGIAQTVFAPAMAENVAAVAAGLPAPNMITKTLYDVFVYMGGSGTTLGLLLALAFFGRARSNRTLMRFALPTSIFNINEPLVFGIPIVLNPIYAIPFVLTPVVMFSTTVLAMTLGWVPYTTAEVSWATPVFFSGYVATGSAAGVYEDHAWLAPLRAFVRGAYAARTPLLGICFGHQIIADALGGEVRKSEKGWGLGRHRYQVKARPGFMGDAPGELAIACSHQDQVIVPPEEAEVILASDFAPNAGLLYRNGAALSFQPHPEFADDYALALTELRRGRAPDDVVDTAVASLATRSNSVELAGYIANFFKRR